MDAHNGSRKKRGSLIWLLVVLAVLLVWWMLRPSDDTADRAGGDAVAAEAHDPDEILVDLRDHVGDEVVARLEREHGIDLVLVSDQSKDERFYRAKVAPQAQAEVLAALSRQPEVEVAEPDATVSLDPVWTRSEGGEPAWEGFPNDPKYPYQWHLRQIKMPAAWKLADGKGVSVAVLDTGVAYEDRGDLFHRVEDLEGVEFVKPYNFVDNTEHANDDHGHGTHVTGTIAQATHNKKGVAGVAREVRVMPLKVLSGRGSGSIGGIADAIRYAADEGADVINMSLGGRFPSKVLERAVKYAHDQGVVVVAAAGNDGRGKVGYPAAYPHAIAVAATQYDEATTFYSNYGKAIDVAAPGGNTRVDQNGDGMPDGVLQNTIAIGDPKRSDYFGFMGTSMASPHVAGVAALVVGAGVNDPAAVERILENTARGPGGRDHDRERYGAGIVDAEAAVLEARSSAGAWQLGLGLLLAGAVAVSSRRRGKLGAGYVAGAVAGASGLFFLPQLAGGLASLPGVELLTRGLPAWDLAIFGAAAHGNPLFYSALVPFGLIALLHGVPRLRAPLAGLALGVAGHLAVHAVAPMADIAWIPNALDGAWLAVNAAACVGLAHLVLRGGANR